MNRWLSVCVAALLLAACSNNGGTGPELGGGNSGTRGKAEILRDIDDNWQSLGYAAKPSQFVALSFDDGPAGASTQNLLAVLAAKKVRATFFLIGQNIRGNKTTAQAIYDGGHELANHSDGYSALGGSTAEDAIRTSLTAAQAAITEITGKAPVLFRAPNVAYGANLTAVCAGLGLAIIGVSIWSNDYQSGITAEQIQNNVLTSGALVNGGIINCHEPNTAPQTVAALPGIIDGLREKGFWILTVGELAAVQEIPLAAGQRYDTIK
jgi:peptidoglycan/xylan/chitin deacetylase (PgdA/CDA1 family)